MIINNLGQQNSLVQQYVAELRDVVVQKDRMRFRRNLERLGEIFAYEISKELAFEDKAVDTPLGVSPSKVLKYHPVLAHIFRAGAPMHQGLMNFFDWADNAFISAYRKHTDDGSFSICIEYLSCPDLCGRTLIICDPMLATAASMIGTLKELIAMGEPKEIYVCCAVAAKPGIDALKEELPQVKLWTAAIDPELNEKSYIVPGLGDAGDLAFGNKIQQ